jgi:hypothetical protein
LRVADVIRQSMTAGALPLQWTEIFDKREKARKVAAARAELAKNALPIGFAASFDSLDIMERVMRHFYLRALIEERTMAEPEAMPI